MRLGDLVQSCGVRGVRVLGARDGGGEGAGVSADVAGVRICDITEDSRTVVPGSLFVARGGLRADGKEYIRQAIASGAVAILTDDAGVEAQADVPILVAEDVQLASALMAERFYGNHARAMDLVGITGTNGKTTTTALLWQILNACARRCGLIGTVVIDDGVEVAPANMTTPPAIEISRSLGRMHEAGCEACAMEVSSHALHQKRADALGFRVAGFTNLTGDHLDYHGTMEAYAASKARLFELIRPGGVAIVNALDPWSGRMVRDCKERVLRVAVLGANATPPAGLQAWVRIVEQSLEGMRLSIRLACEDTIEALVPLVGEYNACNVLIACVAATELGVTSSELAGVLPQLTAPPGRLERVTPLWIGGSGESRGGEGFHVFVDYAHTDDALRNVIQAVASVHPSRHAGRVLSTSAGGVRSAPPIGGVYVVFGCGGDRDRSKRPRMGRVAAELADSVIITSDNPRTERPSDIIDQILAGVPEELRHKVSVQVDRGRAIERAIELAGPGDVVIIAGKGHETEQILADPQKLGATIRTHFDDREVAKAGLARRGILVANGAGEGKSVRRPRGVRTTKGMGSA
jgi:UDP-N-acetylmuramoyl-L-alanyl-D-glutamate--2,6-diaminopimelate ligase